MRGRKEEKKDEKRFPKAEGVAHTAGEGGRGEKYLREREGAKQEAKQKHVVQARNKTAQHTHTVTDTHT